MTIDQSQTVSLLAVAAATILYFQTPYSKERSRLHVWYLHIGIRLNHLLKSWFFLKPLLSPNLSGYHHHRDDQPDIGYIPKLVMKFVWIVAGAFKTHGILGQILYKFGGVEWILRQFFAYAEQEALERCEATNPKGFTKPMKIDEYDWKNGSPEEFYEKYVKTPKPVILRGFANETDAMKWTFSYMLEAYGEEDVFLTNKDVDGFPGKLKQLSDPANYLHNSEVLFQKYPKLMRDLQLERLAPYCQKGLGYTQLFVGLQGTGTPLHCAANWNWFTMLDGEKTWYFVDPGCSWFVYPFALLGRAASFCLPRYPDDPQNDRFWPLMKWCPYYKATIGPGDVLLNPPYWWHAIRNVSEQTVAVASRWHGDGSVGRGFVFTSEDYEINRFLDFCFFVGLQSYPFMQSVLATPSPKYDEHTTVRERKNRFTDIQSKFSKQENKF